MPGIGRLMSGSFSLDGQGEFWKLLRPFAPLQLKSCACAALWKARIMMPRKSGRIFMPNIITQILCAKDDLYLVMI